MAPDVPLRTSSKFTVWSLSVATQQREDQGTSAVEVPSLTDGLPIPHISPVCGMVPGHLTVVHRLGVLRGPLRLFEHSLMVCGACSEKHDHGRVQWEHNTRHSLLHIAAVEGLNCFLCELTTHRCRRFHERLYAQCPAGSPYHPAGGSKDTHVTSKTVVCALPFTLKGNFTVQLTCKSTVSSVVTFCELPSWLGEKLCLASDSILLNSPKTGLVPGIWLFWLVIVMPTPEREQ